MKSRLDIVQTFLFEKKDGEWKYTERVLKCGVSTYCEMVNAYRRLMAAVKSSTS